MDWVTNLKAMETRFEGHELLQNNDFDTCVWHVNFFARQLGRLALAINDSREEHRLRLLKRLKGKYPDDYSQVIKMISELQILRKKLDPKQIFPCVATDDYIATLPEDAQKCAYCAFCFREGYDIIEKLCGKHNFCRKCFEKRVKDGRNPLHGYCSCLRDITLQTREQIYTEAIKERKRLIQPNIN